MDAVSISHDCDDMDLERYLPDRKYLTRRRWDKPNHKMS